MQMASAPTPPHSSSMHIYTSNVQGMLPECRQEHLVRGKHWPQTRIVHNAQTHANDFSAGSPTETLLRFLLPLSDEVHKVFQSSTQHTVCHCNPNYSPDRSIGRSDGRCVQRAGTYSVQVDDKHLLDIPSLHVKISKHDYK